MSSKDKFVFGFSVTSPLSTTISNFFNSKCMVIFGYVLHIYFNILVSNIKVESFWGCGH